jgi:hypothetical protein
VYKDDDHEIVYKDDYNKKTKISKWIRMMKMMIAKISNQKEGNG